MEEPVSIDVDLIYFTTGLPSQGESHAQLLDGNTKEKVLAEDMKKMYGIERGLSRIIIKHINGTATRLATKLIACKFLKKCRKEEVPVRVITASA